MSSETQTYEPRPGSVADKVLAHLRSLPRGAELATGALVATLGLEASSVCPAMKAAVDAKAVYARKKGGHDRSPLFWSLTDQSARAEAPAPVPPSVARSVFEWRSPARPADGQGIRVAKEPDDGEAPSSADDSQAPGAEPAGALTDAGSESAPAPSVAGPVVVPAPRAGESRPLRMALWSDGSFEIRRGATLVLLLTDDETRALVRYLEQLGTASDA